MRLLPILIIFLVSRQVRASEIALSCDQGLIQRSQGAGKAPLIAVVEEGFVKSCEFKKTANKDLVDVDFWTQDAGTSKRFSEHKRGRLKISTMDWALAPALISEKSSP